jgi:hypothetical protein
VFEMLEPVTTITAVSLLAAFLTGAMEEAGGRVSDAAQAALGRLHDLIRRRFSGESYDQQTLERFEQRPGDERRQRALDDVLSETAEADPDFARELADLVAEVRRSAGDSVQITDAGAVAIGGNVVQKGRYVAGSASRRSTTSRSRSSVRGRRFVRRSVSCRATCRISPTART